MQVSNLTYLNYGNFGVNFVNESAHLAP